MLCNRSLEAFQNLAHACFLTNQQRKQFLRANLNRALSQVHGISSQSGSTPLAACPNCSQTISRLFAMADPPVPVPGVAAGQASTRDPTMVPSGLQNPEGSRVVNRNGMPTILPASPLAQNFSDPANAQANQAAYATARGTGDVSGLTPGAYRSPTWGSQAR